MFYLCCIIDWSYVIKIYQNRQILIILANNHQLVPCSPNSVIHLSYSERSFLPTEGLTFFSASLKSSIVKGTVTSFSNSFIHSKLPNFLPSPPSLFNFLLMGMQAASLQSSAISAPEYPSVFLTTSSRSTVAQSCTSFRLILNIYRRPTSVGNGMQILFYNLLLIASSRSQGRFVAPMTTIDLPYSPELTPSILVMSSVLTFLLDSSSFQPLLEARESISSMKMVVGAQNLAIQNRRRTNFSESPFHFEARLDAVTLKKVVLPPEAIALASKVLPVPGGPKRSTPFQALRMPLNKWGITNGSNTAYSSTSFAFSSSAMSSKVISGLNETTSFSNISIRLESGPFPSGQHDFKKDFLYSSADFEFGFFALTSQGLGQSRPLPTPLLFAVTVVGLWLILGVVFLMTGFFFGQISQSFLQNYLCSSYYLSLFSLSLCSLSLYASLASFSFLLQIISSSFGCLLIIFLLGLF